MDRTATAEERRERWREDVALYDEWDFTQWIIALLHRQLETIETIIGAEKVAEPLFMLLEEMNTAEGYDDTTWRQVLDHGSPAGCLTFRIGAQLDELGLYGRFGVTSVDVPLDDRAAHIEGLLTEAEAFLETSGLDRIGGKDNEVAKISRLARARWNLDTGRGGIDPASLAILGGLSEGRIRNMMSGGDRIFENVGGRVTAAIALAWLRDRPDFFDSIWDREEDEAVDDPASGNRLEDIVFVPVARDRSLFHPGLARNGRYQVGAKGAEVSFETFDDALAVLQRMPEPQWRRPNAAGNWGIVKAIEWARLERWELERMTAP